MERRILAVICSVAVVVSLAGCATTRRSGGSDEELDSLRNQLTMLQMELDDKNQELADLRASRMSQGASPSAIVAVPAAATVKSATGPTTKQIQTALMNAGFNPGPVDGKMGAKTREAIKAFQKASGLKVDGKVGAQTWGVLKKYLKVK